MKRWGWAIGIASAASLCLALRRRRAMTTNSGPLQPPRVAHRALPAGRGTKPEPLPDTPLGTNVVCHPSGSPKSSIEPTSPSGRQTVGACRNLAVGFQFPPPSGIQRTRTAIWIVALLVLALAIGCVCFSVVLRKRSLPPLARDNGLTRRALPQTALRDDQRPWISLMQAVPQPVTATGGGFAIKLHNSGKGPALEVRIRDVIRIENTSEDPEFPSIDTAPALDHGMLLPGAEFSTSVGFRTSPATMTELRQGSLRVVNYLLVTYQDLDRHSHITHQCFYWLPRLHLSVACNTGNREE